MWIFYTDVEFTVTCDSQLITCPTLAPAPNPVFSMLVLPSVPPLPASSVSDVNTFSSHSISLLPSAPSPVHPVFDMNSSLCLRPVGFLSWLHLETNPNPKARLALTEWKLNHRGVERKSCDLERGWKNSQSRYRQRFFHYEGTLSGTRIHTHTASFLHCLVNERSLEINVVFSCLLIFLLFGLPWWHSGWESTS